MTAKFTVLRGYNLLASERDTVRGVQVRTSAVYILASERSERDTLRGNAIEISLYLFIYLFIYMVHRTSFSARASNRKEGGVTCKSFLNQ